MADNYNDLALNLLKAMDIMSSTKVEALSYDKTVVCEIISNTNAKKGEYTVSDTSTEFLAYSDNTEYSVGTKVYVTVPNGDWDNKKIIKGKYVSDDTEYYTYTSPLNDFLDITDNLVGTSINANQEWGLAANGSTTEMVAWAWGVDNINTTQEQFQTFINNADTAGKLQFGYTRLAFAANFRTQLRSVGTYAGTYGIELHVYSYQQGNNNTSGTGNILVKEYVFPFACNQFFGNPYGFEVSQRQVILFDISEIKDPIIGMKLVFFQRKDFFGTNGALIPAQNINNIFMSNPYISLGHDISTYTTETPLLYCLGSRSYASTSVDANQLDTINSRRLEIRWIHERTKGSGKFYCIDQYNEIPYYETGADTVASKGVLKLYQYSVEEINEYSEDTAIAGPGWKKIAEYGYNSANSSKLQTNVVLSSNRSIERFKLVIEYPTTAYANQQASENQDLQKLDAKLDILILQKQYNIALTEAEEVYVDFSDVDSSLSRNYTIREIQREIDRLTAERASIIDDYLEPTQYYESDILEFVNESEVPNYVTMDLVNGLNIICDQDGFEGNYQCYRQDGKIVNSADAQSTRRLQALFNSVRSGFSEFDGPAIVHWYIPTSRTMIQMPQEGVEYNLGTNETVQLITDTSSKYCNMFCITRTGVDILSTNSTAVGINQAASLEQVFRIKDFYSYNFNNNTVYCEIEKNNRTYTAEYTMTFGISGNNGTKYSFYLELDSQKNCFTYGEGSVKIIPHLFNYQNQEITDQYRTSITYKWYSENDSGILNLNINNSNNDRVCTIVEANDNSVLNNTKKQKYYHYIVQAQVRPSSLSTYLTAYLPIAVSFPETGFTFPYIDGGYMISYNSRGTDPSYYKDPFILYQNDGTSTIKVPGANGTNSHMWEIALGSDTNVQGTNNNISNFYPIFQNVANEYRLVPTSMALTGIGKQVSAIGKKNGSIVWVQPLIISQYGYESELMNSWDGNLTIDENNGTILSAMIGAGIKNPDNTFSGVLMGDVGTKAKYAKTDIGLYGFYHNEQSYGLNIDGTAFFGRSGTGRIEFDGNNGIIQSASYKSDPSNPTGMKIDLDDGIIDIRGMTISNEVTLPVYEYQIDEETGEVTGKTQINEVTKTYTTSGGQVTIQALTPYLEIKAATNLLDNSNANKEIFYVGSDRIDFTTANYVEGTSGVKIHLGGVGTDANNTNNSNAGYIKAFGNFLIQALKKTNNKQSGIILGSSGNPYLRILHQDNSLMNITDSAFVMQSPNYQNVSNNLTEDNESKAAGVQIDLVNGTIKATKLFITTEQFKLSASETDNNIKTGLIMYSNGSPFFRITYKNGDASEVKLLDISKTAFVMQSPNYSTTTGSEAGMKIDLRAGTIDAYSLKIKSTIFSLDATQTDSDNKVSGIQIHSDGNPFLRLHYNSKDLLKINKNGTYVLQTADFVDNVNGHGAGIQIDLKAGTIKAYKGLRITAYKSPSSNASGDTTAQAAGWIDINSNAATYPLSIGTGSSATNANFKVDWNGTLYATGAVISGSDISTGKVGSWIIDAGGHLYYATGNSPALANATVFLSATGITNNDLSTNFKVSSDLLSANSTKALMIKAGNNFAVSTDGNIYAKAGYIGGWAITATELRKLVSKKYYTYLWAPATIDDGTERAMCVYTWDSTLNSNAGDWASQFFVTYAGKMFAKNAEITGKVTATSGSFTGKIEAGEGKIGGWTIKTDWLERKTDAYNVYLYAPTNISGSDKAFYVGTISSGTQTDQFYVTYDGKMYAKNAEISGKITATSGKIGDVEIDSDGNLDISSKITAAVGEFGFLTADDIETNHISADYIDLGGHALSWYGSDYATVVIGGSANYHGGYDTPTITGTCSGSDELGRSFSGTCSITLPSISVFFDTVTLSGLFSTGGGSGQGGSGDG